MGDHSNPQVILMVESNGTDLYMTTAFEITMLFSFISHLRRERQCDPGTATHTSKEATDSGDDDDDDAYDDHGDNSSIANADILLSLKKGQTTSQPVISLNSSIR